MWFYKDQLFDNVLEEFDSFVYLIERLNVSEDSQAPIFYVGKKTFYNKSKYKGKRIIVESDWWDYYGSSEWLSEHVEKYGKHNFKRTILHLCRTKGDAGYLEAKEQMDRNVLHEENGYKLYYNKNVLGRYRNEPEIYLLESDLNTYYNLDELTKNKHNKAWVTDSKNNRLVSKKIADELVSNGNWFYGKSEKHIEVNNGLVIPKSEYDEKIHDIMVKDQNTESGQINQYLNSKNKISIIKNNQLMWILEPELHEYLEDGWGRVTKTTKCDLYVVTDNINQKYFINKNEKDLFLKNNLNWRDGQLHKQSFVSTDTVFAKDIRTDEKVLVPKDEFKNNKFLVSVRTKKVKIKKRNRIIFNGYLDLFLIENPQYPKNQMMAALKSDTGDLVVQQGKNTWLNDEKLNIRIVK